MTNIVVHHTSRVQFLNGGLSPTPKQLQDYEMDKRGFSDIPYQFVITADGRIYQGRELKSVGAHAGEIAGNKDIKKDPDWGSIGIVLMGDFEGGTGDGPTQAELDSRTTLVARLMLDYQGIRAAQILKHSEVKRSGDPKACPGKRLSPKVDELRTGAVIKEVEDAVLALQAAATPRQ